MSWFKSVDYRKGPWYIGALIEVVAYEWGIGASTKLSLLCTRDYSVEVDLTLGPVSFRAVMRRYSWGSSV